jgi:hypothetical protein
MTGKIRHGRKENIVLMNCFLNTISSTKNEVNGYNSYRKYKILQSHLIKNMAPSLGDVSDP